MGVPNRKNPVLTNPDQPDHFLFTKADWEFYYHGITSVVKSFVICSKLQKNQSHVLTSLKLQWYNLIEG